jgi:hypothetical protein
MECVVCMFMPPLLLDGLVCVSMKRKGPSTLMLLFNVVCCTVVLGSAVSLVCWSRAPEKLGLILGFMALEPMETHAHGFIASGLNIVVVYIAKDCCVVSVQLKMWGMV